jgi:hypothetical protein
MIKLLDILREIESNNSVWYHGSTIDIKQSELDPLFRQNKGKEFMSQKAHDEGSTGSQNSTGIYFGRDKTCRDSFCPINYTGFFATADYKQGFMYQMKLKSDAKVEKKNDLHNIGVDAFKKYREEGIDAFTNGAELNLLNPDAIASFTKIDSWRIIPALYPILRGKAQTDKKISFKNNKDLLDYLKKELLDYKLVKVGEKQVYQSTNDNVDKSFQYGTDRKWDNDLIK